MEYIPKSLVLLSGDLDSGKLLLPEEEIVFRRKATGLVRTAGIFTTAAVAFLFVTQGIFFYPTTAIYEYPGLNLPLSYSFATIIMVWSAFAVMYVTVAMPRTSSDYVAVSRLIHPVIGYMGSVLQWQLFLNWAGGSTGIQAWWLGAYFGQIGTMLKLPDLVSLGSYLATDFTAALSYGIIVNTIFALICLVGMRWYGRFATFFFVVPVVLVMVGAGVLGYYTMAGPAATRAAWDATYGAGAYQEIINVSDKYGWADWVAKAELGPNGYGFPGDWSWAATANAVLPAGFAVWGYEISNMAAGEIKEPSKTYPYAIILSTVLVTIWYLSAAYFMTTTFGDWLSRYVYVMYGGNGADEVKLNPVAFPNIATFQAGLVGGWSFPLAALLGITAYLIYLPSAMVLILLASRNMFSWSFDRVFPEAFSKVNARWHTPHWSILFVYLVSLVYMVAVLQYPYLLAVNVYASATLRYIFVCWAAMVLPYYRPELWERTAPWRIGGIPLATIIGIIGTFTTTWFFVKVLSLLKGDDFSILYQAFWIAFSVVLFGIYTHHNKKIGVDQEALFKTIPPA